MSKSAKLILAIVILVIAAGLILWNLGVFSSGNDLPETPVVPEGARDLGPGHRVAPGTQAP